MDPRVSLLREFYRGLPQDRVKVETSDHGFAFLESLVAGGGSLDYGELTLSRLLHKYKLTGVPTARLDELLAAHVAQTCNVCLYFDDRANNVFCFNLDNNHKTGNTAVIPEMERAVQVLADRLRALGCEPLIVASGRGFHLWCRLDRAVENPRLYGFMLRAAVVAAAAVHQAGGDYRRVKFNFYPDPRIGNVVSLRLFGSVHAKNKVFSHVLGPRGLLDESASWAAFADHLRDQTISAAAFEAACAALDAAG